MPGCLWIANPLRPCASRSVQSLHPLSHLTAEAGTSAKPCHSLLAVKSPDQSPYAADSQGKCIGMMLAAYFTSHR